MSAGTEAPAAALVVDDHPVNRALLAQQLAALGFEVDCAVDGRDGLIRWQATRHPLAIIDRAMPVMDGTALARAIRAIEAAAPGFRALLIGCTANTGTDVERCCIEAGMDTVLAKPCDMNTLESALRACGALPSRQPVSQPQPDTDVSGTPVDMAFVARSYGAGPDGGSAMLNEFVAVTMTDAQALRAAAAQRDAPAVEHNAHRILGASRMIAARELAKLAAHLESIARAGEWRRIEAAIGACELEFARIATFAASFGRELR